MSTDRRPAEAVCPGCQRLLPVSTTDDHAPGCPNPWPWQDGDENAEAQAAKDETMPDGLGLVRTLEDKAARHVLVHRKVYRRPEVPESQGDWPTIDRVGINRLGGLAVLFSDGTMSHADNVFTANPTLFPLVLEAYRELVADGLAEARGKA